MKLTVARRAEAAVRRSLEAREGEMRLSGSRGRVGSRRLGLASRGGWMTTTGSLAARWRTRWRLSGRLALGAASGGMMSLDGRQMSVGGRRAKTDVRFAWLGASERTAGGRGQVDRAMRPATAMTRGCFFFGPAAGRKGGSRRREAWAGTGVVDVVQLRVAVPGWWDGL